MKRVFLPTAIWSLIISSLFLAGPVSAKLWIIKVTNNKFTPSVLTHVKGGDTIRWVWEEGVHTSTSTSVPSGAEPWDNPLTQEDPIFNYVPGANGTFHYCCSYYPTTMTGSFTVSGVYGIDPGPALQATLFPNPASGPVTITLSAGRLKSLHIYSMKGDLVRSTGLRPGSLPATAIIDLSDLAPGIYLIRVTDQLDRSVTRRIIRN